jgi:hypothetical protein
MIAPRRRWWVGLCLVAVLAAALESTGFWQTMPLAAVAGGIWVGGGWRGLLAGALGVVLAWGAYLAFFALTAPLGGLGRLFAAIAGLDPASSGAALLPLAATLLLALLLGGAGGWLGGALSAPSRRGERR